MNNINTKHKNIISGKSNVEINEDIEELLKDALDDVKNNNVMTLEELRKDVANWK